MTIYGYNLWVPSWARATTAAVVLEARRSSGGIRGPAGGTWASLRADTCLAWKALASVANVTWVNGRWRWWCWRGRWWCWRGGRWCWRGGWWCWRGGWWCWCGGRHPSRALATGTLIIPKACWLHPALCTVTSLGHVDACLAGQTGTVARVTGPHGGWGGYDGDIGASRPDLWGLLYIPSPAKHVVPFQALWHNNLVHNVKVELLAPVLPLLFCAFRHSRVVSGTCPEPKPVQIWDRWCELGSKARFVFTTAVRGVA